MERLLGTQPRRLLLPLAVLALAIGVGQFGEGAGPRLLDPLQPDASKPAQVQPNWAPSAGLPPSMPAPGNAPQPRGLHAAGALPDAADLPTPRPLPPAEGSLLLPAGQSLGRSEQLENISQQADRLTRQGFELAGREAYFAARAEFITALRLIAQGLDAEHQTTLHSRSLAAGLTAIKEAEDFIPSGSRMEADLELASIIGSHRTPVLKSVAAETLTPLWALKCYFTFAQEQLAAAVGREVAGSIALHALGKLHAALALTKTAAIRVAEPKAMTFYQAALLACPQNYMAANDLGVLMARCGSYAEARTVLEHSLTMRQPSVGWHNLALVYRQLGQFELARRASGQAEMARRAEQARAAAARNPGNQLIQWVEPAAFARSSFEPPPTGQTRAPAASAPQGSAGSQRPAAARPTPAERPAPAPQPATTAWPPRVSAADPQRPNRIVLCQALGPAAPCNICGVDCSRCNCRHCWESARLIAWQAYAQGEYVGHDRLAHVPEYRLRPDDQLDMIYRLTREETATPYRLNVGDEIRVESFADPELNRDLLIQPDGTITLRLIGQVHATGRTVQQIREALDEHYQKYYKVPAMTVTPLRVNTKLEDLRATVDRRAGIGGQSQLVRVTPEGTISLPAIGSIRAQNLTLGELQQELSERYRQEVEGIEIIPVLALRAPRFVFVLGEVRTPGRFELTGPTTILQAISMAGSWNVGANLRQIVVFRRGDDWRLLATMVNLDAALRGRQPCPPGEIWLSDSDVIIVPKSPILEADDFINLIFTRGIYGVFPMSTTLNFSKLSTL